MNNPHPTIFAGIPTLNAALYHRMRFLVGDPAACIITPRGDTSHTTLIIRDIEVARAKQHARADEVYAPADFTPDTGLSGDRETATAQALAEYLRRQNINTITADRSLPHIYIHHLQQAGIQINYDPQLGVAQRRVKDDQEIAYLHEAQAATERVMECALTTIARATPNAEGELIHENAPLTAQRVRELIDIALLREGYENPGSIVAPGRQGADCHHHGHGIIHTGVPVIIDIFPRNKTTRYNGDCTRTVVHGDIPDRIQQMHTAVANAKAAATAATRAGVTGEDVHRATINALEQHGFIMGLPQSDSPEDFCSMPHGTGHGIGLEVHEPPLLDLKGPELVVGDALTIEPGLYQLNLGGIRLEDMVIVTQDGCKNLNQLPEALNWA